MGHTIFLMTFAKTEMAVSLPNMIYGIPICASRKEGARVMRQRVEIKAVDNHAGNLKPPSVMLVNVKGLTLTYISGERRKNKIAVTPTERLGYSIVCGIWKDW